MNTRHWSEDADAIRQISAWLVEAGLAEIEIADDAGERLRIVAQAGGGPPDTAAATPAGTGEPAPVTVTAPAFGHLRIAVAADGMPRPAAGAVVLQGETIGVLEVGTVAVPVVAPCAGTFVRWLATPDALTGYGAALALVGPAPESQA